MKTKIKLLLLAVIYSGFISAQDKWDTDGNDLPNNNKLGSKNNRDVNIFTNDIKRGEFTKNGKFNFFGTIKADTLRADSLVINGGARIKGRLHVGNNSLWLGSSTPVSGTDDITSTNGVINFGGEPTVPLPFSQIKIGMGTQLPQFNLHLVDSRTPSNRVILGFANATTNQTAADGFQVGIFGNGRANLNQQETNLPITLTTAGGFVGVSNTNLLFNPASLFHISDGANQTDMQVTNNSTGNNVTDGFKFGITNTGIGQIKQQENLDIQFHTNNAQRMVIKNTGFVGINTNTPGNQLELNSTLASAAALNGGPVAPTFGPPTGASGLRFSDLNSTSIPQNNTSGKILSVNAAGDVILVPDGGTAGPGGVTAKNGLNVTVGAPDVELGGNLIRHTDVITNNTGGTPFDMVFNGNGQFGFGEGLAAGFLNPDAKINANNNTKRITMQVENNNGTTPATLNNEAGHFVAKGINNGWFNVGIYGEAQNSSVYNIGGIFSGASAAGSINYGVSATAANAPTNFGLAATASGATGDISNQGAVINASLGQFVYGINNVATGDANTQDLIGISSAISSGNNAGVLKSIAIAGINNSQSASSKYGVQGVIDQSNTTGNVALSGIVGFNGYYSNSINHPVTNNIANIAVYGGFAGNNPIFSKTLPDNLAGYFDGDVYIGGGFNITSGGFALTSDSQFKTNINALGSTKAIIALLQPKTFYFDTTNSYNIKFDHKKQYGLIAQDVEQILPELVSAKIKYAKKDSVGNTIEAGTTYKALNYNAFIGILLANAKEQNNRIDSLINALNNSNARQGSSATPLNIEQQVKNISLQSVTLSNADAIVLDQNQPNPFSESTVIKYNVPEKYSYAQLIFTTVEGRILKTIDIAKKGAGEITVYANDLSNGIYNYTLVVDGKTIDSKKMIKQN